MAGIDSSHVLLRTEMSIIYNYLFLPKAVCSKRTLICEHYSYRPRMFSGPG